MLSLDDLIGAWALLRHIEQSDGTQARFKGRAEWFWGEDHAVYQEKGQLFLAGQNSFHAERRYVWRGLDVYFEDGRFFHSVPPKGGITEHWCAPDMYRVAYDFTQWPHFETTWTVTGPRKSYRMRSQYTQA